MAKTCRTCEFWNEFPQEGWCFLTDGKLICKAKTPGCEDHKPRETPLLVNVLAIAAKLLLEKMDNIGDGMLFNLDLLDARDILKAALARYKEEVGDA